jgi:hypothetical protein
MRHCLPTIQEILDSVWSTFPQKDRLDLRFLGRSVSFCDGVGVPRTSITSNDRQIKDLFQKHELKAQTVIAKEGSWFVKFDEDSAPDFDTLKHRLHQLSSFAHEQLAGQSEFFF